MSDEEDDGDESIEASNADGTEDSTESGAPEDAPIGSVDVEDVDDPFDELDADVEDVDLDALFEEMFTERETGEIDPESVWEQLEGGESEPRETGREEHVVSVREFCAQCEYAAEPPEVYCTYEGSEIVEFVDKNTVRVRNCPIVAQRRQVGDME